MVNVLLYIGDFILLINLYIYLKSYKNFSIAFKIFSYYLILSFTIEIITSFYFESGENNLYLSHYYFISQFILLSLFFKQLLKNPVFRKLISVILIIVLVALGVYYINFPSNYYKFNVFEIVITSLPLLVYSFLFFIQKMEGTDKRFIYIVSGFFLYVLCSTLLFTVGNIEAEIKRIIWYSNALLYIVYQVLIFVEWYKNFREKSIKSVNS